jgi:Integrase core domain
MSDRPDTDLVTDALMMAFPRRRPDRRVVHHSDRGAVYTSLAFSHQLTERSLAQSFGSTSDAHDNAAAEAFWATLKRELAWIHQRTTWSTRTELRTAVFDHIEAFYNPERIPRRLGHHNPRRLQEDHRRRLNPVSTEPGQDHVGAERARWSVVGWPWSGVTGESGRRSPARGPRRGRGLSLLRDRAGAVADG